MSRCIIVSAGDISSADFTRANITQGDYVIAADGGYLYCENFGVTPNLIIGDFDSAPPPSLADVTVKTYPVVKDDTDTILAIKEGFALGYSEFILLGAMGGNRFDHSIANIQSLHYIASNGGVGIIIAEGMYMQTLSNASATFKRCEGKFSLFALTNTAENITIKGSKYDVTSATLTADFPLGVGNDFLGESIEVSVGDGVLLVIISGKD